MNPNTDITGQVIETLNQLSAYSVDVETFLANKEQIKQLYAYLIQLFKSVDFASPDSPSGAIDSLVQMVVNHIADLDNPHIVTYLQTGFGETSELIGNTDSNGNPINTVTGLYFTASDGTFVKLLSPLSLDFTTELANFQSALDEKSYDMSTHIADMNNPHQTTYLQTGFSNFIDPSGTVVTGVQLLTNTNVTLTIVTTADPTYVALQNNVATLATNLTTLTNNFNNLGLRATSYLFFNNSNGVSVQVANQSDLDANISNVNATIASLQTNLQGQITTNTNNIADLNTSVTELQGEVGQDQSNIGNLTTRVTNVENVNATQSTQIQALQNATSNIDNTSDLNKPISTAMQTALTNLQNAITTIQGVDTTQNAQISTNTDNINQIGQTVQQLEGLLGGGGITFSSPYATTDDVEDPSESVLYLIGTAPPYDLYIWTAPTPPATEGTWTLVGTLGINPDNFVTLISFNAFTAANNTRIGTIETTLPTMQTSINANASAISALQTAPPPSPSSIGLGNVQNVDTTTFNNITAGQIQGFQFLPTTNSTNVSTWVGGANLGLTNLTATSPLAGNGSVIGLPVGTSAGSPIPLTRPQLQSAIGPFPIGNTSGNLPIERLTTIGTQDGIMQTTMGIVHSSPIDLSNQGLFTGQLPLSSITGGVFANGFLRATSGSISFQFGIDLNTDTQGNLPLNRLVQGANGQALMMTSGVAGWRQLTIADTTGNIPLARIPAGTNGQFLSTVSGVPTWVASPGVSGRLALSNMPTTATANRVLLVAGASTDPQYAQVNLTNMVTGRLPMGNMPTSGTANRVLLVGATANANPVYGQVDLGSMVTGTLGAGNIATTIARVASPAFTGTPTAPTAGAGTNTTQIATTAFVQSALAGARRVVTDIMVSGTINVTFAASPNGFMINTATINLPAGNFPGNLTTVEVVTAGTLTAGVAGSWVTYITRSTGAGSISSVTVNVISVRVSATGGSPSFSFTVNLRVRVWQGVQITRYTINRPPQQAVTNVTNPSPALPAASNVLFMGTESSAGVARTSAALADGIRLFDLPLGTPGSNTGATGAVPIQVFVIS